MLFGLALALVAAACTSSSTNEPTPTDGAASVENPVPDTDDAGGDGSDQADAPAGDDGDGESESFAGTLRAPEFPPDLDWLNTDRPLTLGQLEGKVVLLDFWTYGCINCIHVIPDLKRLEAEYPDELVVIGVHSAKFDNESNTENIRQIILRYGIEHAVVNDGDFAVWDSFGVRAWPTLFAIDPAGNVVGFHSGEGVYEVVEPVVASLVDEFDASGVLDRTPIDLKLENEGLPETVLSFPGKLTVDPAGDRLFISDTNHNRIVAATLEGDVLGVFGSGSQQFVDGPSAVAAFDQPQGTALSADGSTLYVADTGNHAVRAIDLATGDVSTVTGTGEQASWPPRQGTVPTAELASPWDVELDGSTLYVAMAGTHQIWALDLDSGDVGPYAGSGAEGTRNTAIAAAELAQPSGLALADDGRLFFTDSESSAIRWADTQGTSRAVGVLAGSDEHLFDFGDVDGVGTAARLQHPLGVAVDGDTVWIADTYNSKIKRIDAATGETTTYAGGEPGWRDGDDALFYEPGGLEIADGTLYVADTNNHAVRTVDVATGEVDTLVLRGIAEFLPTASDAEYAGTVVLADRIEVAEGEAAVVLDVEIPAGYKVNPEAPSSFEWTSVGPSVEFAAGSLTVIDPVFPLRFDAIFQEGVSEVTGDISVVYCDAEAESICLIEQLRVVVPVAVVAGAADQDAVVRHAIELPDL